MFEFIFSILLQIDRKCIFSIYCMICSWLYATHFVVFISIFKGKNKRYAIEHIENKRRKFWISALFLSDNILVFLFLAACFLLFLYEAIILFSSFLRVHPTLVLVRARTRVCVCVCICNFNDLVNVTFDDILYNLLFMLILNDRKIVLELIWFQVSSFLDILSFLFSFCVLHVSSYLVYSHGWSVCNGIRNKKKKKTYRFFCISFLALWADTRFSQLKWSIIPTQLTISGICYISYIRVCCGVSSFYFAT